MSYCLLRGLKVVILDKQTELYLCSPMLTSCFRRKTNNVLCVFSCSLIRSRILRASIGRLALLTFTEAVSNFVDTEDLWWCELNNNPDFEMRVVEPCGKSWSNVRKNPSGSGVIEGKIRSVRYFLHIPAPALEIAVDVSRISLESQRDFAAYVLSVWPMQHGRCVRPTRLQQYFGSLGSLVLESLLDALMSNFSKRCT